MNKLARKITKKQWHSGKWVIDYIQEVSLSLFEITAYREKT